MTLFPHSHFLRPVWDRQEIKKKDGSELLFHLMHSGSLRGPWVSTVMVLQISYGLFACCALSRVRWLNAVDERTKLISILSLREAIPVQTGVEQKNIASKSDTTTANLTSFFSVKMIHGSLVDQHRICSFAIIFIQIYFLFQYLCQIELLFF